MAKRGPGSDLNDRNWDIEEEPEEAGVFTQATSDVLQQRVIKKAKRNTAGAAGNGSTKPAVFSGFAGLTKTSQTKTDNNNKPPLSGMQFTGSSKPVISFGGGASSSNGAENGKPKENGDEEAKYFQNLKSLNESVLAWIKQHVEANPYIVLSPIFRDYDNYVESMEAKRSSSSAKNDSTDGASSGAQTSFSSLQKPESTPVVKKDSGTSDGGSKPFSFGSTSSEAPNKAFTFGSSTAQSTNGNSGFKFSTSSSTTGSGFSFGNKAEPSKAATDEKKPFSFGLSGNTMSSKPATDDKKPFSFGMSRDTTSSSASTGGFSFGGAAAAAASQSKSADSKDDEEYVPPKPEVKEIKEDDSIFSKRCKLFYQKEGAWVDRGVGNLHLKPVSETKTQLLIRADTNLGNILLNIMLTTSLPVSRSGKNNLFLVCVPNPPISSKPEEKADDTPVSMLIRVKTGEDADELMGIIDERKKLLS